MTAPAVPVKVSVNMKKPQLNTTVIMSGTAKITTTEHNDKGVELRRHVAIRTFIADYDHSTDTFKLREIPKAEAKVPAIDSVLDASKTGGE
jgi:hypothetical protein